MLPLAGVRVIEVGQALAGPLAGAIMADMGADVINPHFPDDLDLAGSNRRNCVIFSMD